VRQGEENQIGFGEHLRRGVGEHQVAVAEKLRVNVGHRLTGVCVCRRGNHRQVRVASDQAQQFRAGISASAGDGYLDSHARYYAPCRNFMRLCP